MNKYIFASSNPNKLLEISKQLSHLELLSLNDVEYFDEIIESGMNLRENALIKSKTIFDKYNIATIADDTGLEVYALNGEPGVFSARYAGQQANAHENINKLLSKMNNVKDRRARFRTVISLTTNNEQLFFEGVVDGIVTDKTTGQSGFGYDPIFVPNGFKKTFAEMSLEEKNTISHRSQAIKKLIEYLKI
ncbi:MAG: non-canonical purine NTP pyrophosphatase, RdgB/HAM1 family [Flavobacteriales bacterium]|jgi:XTP/dITP diphosphohydrolase|nr:non-canonical purine NTP pyrophosphatase, RdgB/HAM1 family [Flavobacteriales bacterium]|tara:strand:- start:2294 stop:2866 length:573 start_codon:yes stop_codon:yes gene_type:complete